MISRLLDPVLLGLVALVIALVPWTLAHPRKANVASKLVAWTAVTWLLLLSSPWFANFVVRALQQPPIDLHAHIDSVQPERRALVVLAGGGLNAYDFVSPIEQLDSTTRARLLGGARVYREHQGFGTVVVTGTGMPAVQAMADYLVLLGVPRERIVLEPQATDTLTNATHSAQILRSRSIDRLVLVTSALHMPRSLAAFQRAGLEPLPAPADYIGPHDWRLLPSTGSLGCSAFVLHELLGRFDR
ncbi:MAG: YdcF family protein [Polyangiaceae bacterium]|jgi:uncharacterized SAM-binding protein YcdF (DUF218 family)|nr:YdcF family protein [Polyangiaceae bacterium]